MGVLLSRSNHLLELARTGVRLPHVVLAVIICFAIVFTAQLVAGPVAIAFAPGSRAASRATIRWRRLMPCAGASPAVRGAGAGGEGMQVSGPASLAKQEFDPDRYIVQDFIDLPEYSIDLLLDRIAELAP